MKHIIGLVFLLLTGSGYGQPIDRCHDLVMLRDGSVLRGSVTEFNKGKRGNFEMTTWSGTVIRLPSAGVRYFQPKCSPKTEKPDTLRSKPYTFKERGWYYSPRVVTTLAHERGGGIGVQISTGFKFHRLLSAGVGIGSESLRSQAERSSRTIPVFGEIRGFLVSKSISPFYAIGVGWTSVLKDRFVSKAGEEWKSSWMGQTQFGLRIGKHFIAYMGLRFLPKTLEPANTLPFNGDQPRLVKRMEIGLGLVL